MDLQTLSKATSERTSSTSNQPTKLSFHKTRCELSWLFTYLSKSHTWRGSPFWHREPSLLARTSQPKNLPFPPCGRRVSPIQAASFHLQSGDGECLPATQLYLSIFTCPTVSLDLPSDAGESLPARQPFLFHPTAGKTYPSRPRVFSSCRMSARASRPHNLPFCLYLSDTASLDLPLDAGESLPARQPNLSNLLLDEAYPSDTAILKPQSDVGESLPGKQPYLFKPPARRGLPVRHGEFWNHSRTSARASRTDKPARPTQPRCRLTARPSDHLTLTLLSKPVRLGEPRSPDGRQQEHSRPDNLIFSSPRSTRLTRPTQRFWNHSRTSARASQPDNLTFSSPKLGEAFLSDTAIVEATVGRRREHPSQTILPFKSHARRGLPVQHGNYWSHRRTSARASQPDKLILSVCSHHNTEPRRTLHARLFRQS